MSRMKIFRMLGVEIYGSDSWKIDTLVDKITHSEELAYDVKFFKESILRIREELGEEGVCYFILLNYLSRLQELLTRELIQYYSHNNKKTRINEMEYERLKGRVVNIMLYDPRNISSLIAFDEKKISLNLCFMYAEKGMREERTRYKRLMSKALKDINREELLRDLEPLIIRVTTSILDKIDCIIAYILEDYRNSLERQVHEEASYMSPIRGSSASMISYSSDSRDVAGFRKLVDSVIMLASQKCAIHG
jgi:hypothetical protein